MKLRKILYKKWIPIENDKSNSLIAGTGQHEKDFTHKAIFIEFSLDML